MTSNSETPTVRKNSRSKRKRQKRRERHRRGSPSSEGICRRVFISDEGQGLKYRPKDINDIHPSRKRGMIVRSSLRWIGGISEPMVLRVPYYNKLGRDTGHTLYRWKCEPQSLVASCIATVYHRLREYCFRHNSPKVVFRNVGRLLRAATYYIISRNEWFWDRILYFSRNLEKFGNLIHKYTLRLVLKTDDNKRFVYGHATHQAQWLTLQAERPCDKSVKRNQRGGGETIGSRLQSDYHVQCARSIWEIATAISLI